MTLKCDIDLECAWLSHCFCTSFTETNIWVKINENRKYGSGYMERIHNSRVNPKTLTCDLDLEPR